MKQSLPFLVLLLAGIVLLVAAIPTIVLGGDIYSGSVDFQTEEQYSQFKQAIIDSGARISTQGTAILSSEPPIVGKFRITVDRGTLFPYGEQDRWQANGGTILLGVFGTAFALAGIYALIWEVRSVRG